MEMKHWIDNGDSYICPDCGFETANPNYFKDARCPRCGFQDEKDRDTTNKEARAVKFTDALSTALSRVARLKGVIALDEDEIGIAGGRMDDYLLVLYLAQLFENGEAELKVRPSKCEYLFKLLHLREENYDRL